MIQKTYHSSDTFIVVSKTSLRHNVAAIQALLGTVTPTPRLIAVVKANAYGHDAVQAARLMMEAGVDAFAVTTPTEALELRGAGIAADLLVFAPPMQDDAAALIERDVTLTIADAVGVGTVSKAAALVGKTPRVHLKVDTGMGRLGVLPVEAVTVAARIAGDPNLRLCGVYTHFNQALEKDFAPTTRQFKVFQEVLTELKSAGIDPGIRHCANSAALLRDKSMWLDAVRAGTILYGQYPTSAVPRIVDLRDTWVLKTRVVSVRDVPAGTAVGHGAEFVTRRPSRLAVIAIGYADGFTMAPASVTSGWRGIKSLLGRTAPTVTIRGQQAPVVGRVAMQMCTVDVSAIDGVETGDIVIVPCRRLAASARIPRVYEE